MPAPSRRTSERAASSKRGAKRPPIDIRILVSHLQQLPNPAVPVQPVAQDRNSFFCFKSAFRQVAVAHLPIAKKFQQEVVREAGRRWKLDMSERAPWITFGNLCRAMHKASIANATASPSMSPPLEHQPARAHGNNPRPRAPKSSSTSSSTSQSSFVSQSSASFAMSSSSGGSIMSPTTSLDSQTNSLPPAYFPPTTTSHSIPYLVGPTIYAPTTLDDILAPLPLYDAQIPFDSLPFTMPITSFYTYSLADAMVPPPTMMSLYATTPVYDAQDAPFTPPSTDASPVPYNHYQHLLDAAHYYQPPVTVPPHTTDLAFDSDAFGPGGALDFYPNGEDPSSF
ncbi:hypothetical protein EXIGLDRAFT_468438 [Exidia glandulosa HHB12029]|uniref:Uncharacterized protein n=1 Tax=Exidia glandulosa HHB12029 TaxID=1314781 RepID=A0A165K0P1_EXIGL|nr:hypothetical protein EXIGLDRAFT_468438 [Exidia glandulosa HHB12029]